MRRLPGVDTPPRKSTDVQQRSDPQVCKKFESIKEKEDVNRGVLMSIIWREKNLRREYGILFKMTNLYN